MATTTRKSQSSSQSTSTPGAGRAPAASSTPIRNTPIPKSGQQRRAQPTHEQIARRAYEISISGSGGSELDNWFRAERELQGE
jgi:hypothetical protein